MEEKLWIGMRNLVMIITHFGQNIQKSSPKFETKITPVMAQFAQKALLTLPLTKFNQNTFFIKLILFPQQKLELNVRVFKANLENNGNEFSHAWNMKETRVTLSTQQMQQRGCELCGTAASTPVEQFGGWVPQKRTFSLNLFRRLPLLHHSSR